MTARILLSFAFGVLFAAPSAAMAGKFTKQAVDMQSVSVPARRVWAPEKNTDVAPQLTIEEFLGRKQARIQDIIDRQIRYLRSLLPLASPDDPQFPDYHFRLGELFVEKYRYFNNLARSLDEPIFRAEHDASPAAEGRRERL